MSGESLIDINKRANDENEILTIPQYSGKQSFLEYFTIYNLFNTDAFYCHESFPFLFLPNFDHS